jgi:hypothetical protein
MISERAPEHSVQLPKPFIDLTDFGERFLSRHGY